MYFEDGQVHIEEDDQCFNCEYFLKGVECPLLEALAEGVVSLEGDIVVRNCGFFKLFKRHLTLVPKPDPVTPETENPDPPANLKSKRRLALLVADAFNQTERLCKVLNA